jgi:Na+/H+ antiporter
MTVAEITVGLLAGIALLGLLAQRIGWPSPAVLVLGGLAVGLVPGLPQVRLSPDLVLLGFLPPLCYSVAFSAASFDLRSNVLHIGTLAAGLVLVTVAVVAVVGHAVGELPWPAALALGALAAPTDPVSASATIRAVGAPERIVAILEGESLINDGAGLAALQVAVAGAAGGFSLGGGLLRLAEISAGGWAIGLAGGWLLVRLRRSLNEPSLEIVLGLLGAYGVYIAANAAGLSGVLAAVTTGLYAGGRAEEISSAEVRLRLEPFWEALGYVLQSVLFLLVGLQVRRMVDGIPSGKAGTTAVAAVVVIAVCVVLRTAWMFAMEGALSTLARRYGLAVGRLRAAELTVLSWSGMRGALSLAGALSIPTLVAGHAFPGRDRAIFLVYCIVLGTLLVPAVTLKGLIRRLGLGQDDELLRQEVAARARVIHAALARLEELADRRAADPALLDRLRGVYELRLSRAEASGPGGGPAGSPDPAELRRVRAELLRVQRQALADIRRERGAPAQALASIQRGLDLDEARLGSGAGSPP